MVIKFLRANSLCFRFGESFHLFVEHTFLCCAKEKYAKEKRMTPLRRILRRTRAARVHVRRVATTRYVLKGVSS